MKLDAVATCRLVASHPFAHIRPIIIELLSDLYPLLDRLLSFINGMRRSIILCTQKLLPNVRRIYRIGFDDTWLDLTLAQLNDRLCLIVLLLLLEPASSVWIGVHLQILNIIVIPRMPLVMNRRRILSHKPARIIKRLKPIYTKRLKSIKKTYFYCYLQLYLLEQIWAWLCSATVGAS